MPRSKVRTHLTKLPIYFAITFFVAILNTQVNKYSKKEELIKETVTELAYVTNQIKLYANLVRNSTKVDPKELNARGINTQSKYNYYIVDKKESQDFLEIAQSSHDAIKYSENVKTEDKEKLKALSDIRTIDNSEIIRPLANKAITTPLLLVVPKRAESSIQEINLTIPPKKADNDDFISSKPIYRFIIFLFVALMAMTLYHLYLYIASIDTLPKITTPKVIISFLLLIALSFINIELITLLKGMTGWNFIGSCFTQGIGFYELFIKT